MLKDFQADERQIAIQEEWSVCFNSKGFGEFTSFEQLIADRQREVRSDRTTGAEAQEFLENDKLIALAAAECAEPLSQKWQTLREEYEEQFANKHKVPQFPVGE